MVGLNKMWQSRLDSGSRGAFYGPVMNLWVLGKVWNFLGKLSDCQCIKKCAVWSLLFVIPLQKFQKMYLRIILASWSKFIMKLYFYLFKCILDEMNVPHKCCR